MYEKFKANHNPNKVVNHMNLYNKAYEFLKKIVQMSPLMIIPSCILLWSYLNSIGRLDLFTQSLTNPTNLLPLIASFILFAGIFLLIMLVPSMPFYVYYISMDSDIFKNIKSPLALLLTLVFGMACFIFIFFTLVIFLPKNVPLFIWLSILILCFFLTLLSINNSPGIKKLISIRLAVFALFLFSMLYSSIPLGILITYYEASTNQSVFYACIYILVMILSGFTPVSYCLYQKINYKVINKNILIGTFVFALAIPMLMIDNLLSYSINKAMSNIGVSDWRPHAYYINSSLYDHAMFPAQYWDTKEFFKGGFFITAVKPFSLGDSVLLCPTYLIEMRDMTFKEDLDEEKLSEENHKFLLKDMAQKCFVFSSREVKQSDTTFSNTLMTKSVEKPVIKQ